MSKYEEMSPEDLNREISLEETLLFEKENKIREMKEVLNNKQRKETFSPKMLEKLYENAEEEIEDRKTVEVGGTIYAGCYITTDPDTGEFDGEKGSMYDYEIYLYKNEDEYLGVAIGGYFNNICGDCFNSALTFSMEAN